jgi:hypothetical protein
MRRRLAQLKIAALIAVIGIAASTTYEADAAPPAASEVYWRCEQGFAFETSGSSVHCKKPAYTDRRALAGCKIGLYPMVDRIGNKDMCSGTNIVTGEISIERACLASDVLLGYTKRIVDGTDYCGKSIPAEFRAPSVMVTVTN